MRTLEASIKGLIPTQAFKEPSLAMKGVLLF